MSKADTDPKPNRYNCPDCGTTYSEVHVCTDKWPSISGISEPQSCGKCRHWDQGKKYENASKVLPGPPVYYAPCTFPFDWGITMPDCIVPEDMSESRGETCPCYDKRTG